MIMGSLILTYIKNQEFFPTLNNIYLMSISPTFLIAFINLKRHSPKQWKHQKLEISLLTNTKRFILFISNDRNSQILDH